MKKVDHEAFPPPSSLSCTVFHSGSDMRETNWSQRPVGLDGCGSVVVWLSAYLKIGSSIPSLRQYVEVSLGRTPNPKLLQVAVPPGVWMVVVCVNGSVKHLERSVGLEKHYISASTSKLNDRNTCILGVCPRQHLPLSSHYGQFPNCVCSHDHCNNMDTQMIRHINNQSFSCK